MSAAEFWIAAFLRVSALDDDLHPSKSAVAAALFADKAVKIAQLRGYLAPTRGEKGEQCQECGQFTREEPPCA